MFQVAVSVANPADSSRAFEEKFWVDTGAFYTLIPGDRLEAIGVIPSRTRDVMLADGRRHHLPIGEVALTIHQLNETATCLVIFGPPGSMFLLGAHALEAFAVQADPTTQQLTPIAVIIGGFRATRTDGAHAH